MAPPVADSVLPDATYASALPRSVAVAVAPLIPTRPPDDALARATTLLTAGVVPGALFAPASVAL